MGAAGRSSQHALRPPALPQVKELLETTLESGAIVGRLRLEADRS